MNEEHTLSDELEISEGFTVKELEQRLEMGAYCCDYAPDRGHNTSCGYEQ